MKTTYFTVGPSQVYPTVPVHMRQAIMEEIPSLSHRGKGFESLYKKVDKNLRRLMGIPATHHIFFVGSALEGIERTIQNTVGEQSFHFVSGAFSKKAFSMAEELGKKPVSVNVPMGKGFSLDGLQIPKETELIFITENDTSTGTLVPMKDIKEIKSLCPSALLALDVVSSVPYTKIDFSVVDVAIFSVQKGFGLSAGLGVVIVSDKAMKKAKQIEKKQSIGSYHSFLSFSKSAETWQTPETPNVMNIYLLSKITEEMLMIGIKTFRKEIEEKAAMLYAFFDIHPKYRPFVTDEEIRSKTTLVIDVDGESTMVRGKLAAFGIIVGAGYGERSEQQIRIANFPAHTLADVRRLIQAVKKIDIIPVKKEK